MCRLLSVLLVLVLNLTAHAITCEKGSWDEQLCKLPIVTGSRCQDSSSFRLFCNSAVEGCNRVPGGCIGYYPPGHWFALVEVDGPPRWRCRCGCVGEETEFLGQEVLTGKQLLAGRHADFLAEVMDDPLGQSTVLLPINGWMHSPEKWAIQVRTAQGVTLNLSEAHPVLVADPGAGTRTMKQAKTVTVADFLVGPDGLDRVVAAQRVPYQGQMVNFNVMSDRPENHILFAFQRSVGDHGWQETLNGVGSRIFYRSEILAYLEKHGDGV